MAGRTCAGDFGYSLQSGVPVLTLMKNHLPATIELTLTSLVMSSIFGILLGVVCALKKGTALDQILSVVGMVGLPSPVPSGTDLHQRVCPAYQHSSCRREDGLCGPEFHPAASIPYHAGHSTGIFPDFRCDALRAFQHAGFHGTGLYENGQEQGTAGVACEPAARPQGRHDAGGSAH